MFALRDIRIVYTERRSLLLMLLSLSMSACMLITRKAWVPADVDYPRIPMIPFLELNLPVFVLALLFGSTLLVLFLLPFLKDPKKATLFLLGVFVLFFLDGIDRFQPWWFIHFPMILWLSFRDEKWEDVLRWGLVFMYFWGGIHKFNQNFAWEVFPYLMKPFHLSSIHYLPTEEIGSYALPQAFHLAWIVPVTEVLIAVFLLLRPVRMVGIVLAVFVHLITLYILGPFGHNWNSVVWVWNTELLILVIVLFYGKPFQLSGLRTIFGMGMRQKVFVLVMGISPFLWYFGVWPHALSYHLYSGYNPQVNFWFGKQKETGRKDYTLYVDEGVIENNPKIVGTGWEEFTFYDVDRKESFIMVDHYAMKVMNVPIFAEEMYFRVLGKKLCDCFGYSGDEAGIRMELRTKFRAHLVLRSLTCEELSR